MAAADTLAQVGGCVYMWPENRPGCAKVLVLQRNQKEGINSTLLSVEQLKDTVDDRIEQLEIEKVTLKDTEAPATDYLPFVIGIFITILLTCYLFVFYSSSGYSAFYGVKQGSLGFINPNVFSEVKNKGGGVIALS